MLLSNCYFPPTSSSQKEKEAATDEIKGQAVKWIDFHIFAFESRYTSEKNVKKKNKGKYL